ncbi:MAG: SpoIIE family protein phosphatase [Actinomycetota bacterium]|nr:SpoIIE family protein phosphatase [Actinomycetota bacterium]
MEHDHGRRLRALHATGLGGQADPAFDRFARMAQRQLDVPVVLVSLVDESRQFFPGQHGLPDPWAQQRQTPLSHSFCKVVVATAQPLVVTDARLDPRVQDNLAIPDLGVIAYLGVPLTDSEDNVLGSLCAIDQVPRSWNDDDLAAMLDLAAACSSELRLRIEADRARAALNRVAVLAQVTQAVSSTLDPQQTIERLARLVVPFLADWCTVHVADEAGRVQRAASQHRDSPLAAAVGAFAAAQAIVLDPNAPTRIVLRTEEALLLDRDPQGVQDALSRGVDDDAVAGVCADLACASVLVVPLRSRDGAVGVLTLGRGADRPPFGETAIHDAMDLGRRAGLALHHAQMYRRQRHYAESLQRSMLTRLPEPDHLHVVARYVPAAKEAQVGGDWYDSFLQPDGGTMIVVGDVTGHDIAAAAMMGQLRNLLRGTAYDRDEAPAAVLSRVDRALQGLQVETLATVLLARVEQTPADRQQGLRRLRWSNAGHLSPALLRANGVVELLDRPSDLLLGLDPKFPRSDHEIVLEPDDTVLLYTDGLVERRDSPLEHGLARLRQSLGALAGLPLDRLCDELISRIVPAEADDDVAIVAVRTYPEDRPRPPGAGPVRQPAQP